MLNSNKISMLRARIYRILILTLILTSFNFGVNQVSGVEVWTAHVKWVGYNFASDTDCGDGASNTCENRLQIKLVSTSSCASRTTTYGSYENNYPQSLYLGDYYQLTWSRAYGAPCLTFEVKLYENSAGDATTETTLTILSSGTHTTVDLDLSLGTALGYFRIEHWVTATD